MEGGGTQRAREEKEAGTGNQAGDCRNLGEGVEEAWPVGRVGDGVSSASPLSLLWELLSSGSFFTSPTSLLPVSSLPCWRRGVIVPQRSKACPHSVSRRLPGGQGEQSLMTVRTSQMVCSQSLQQRRPALLAALPTEGHAGLPRAACHRFPVATALPCLMFNARE